MSYEVAFEAETITCKLPRPILRPQKLNPTTHPITRITDVDTLYEYLEDARPLVQPGRQFRFRTALELFRFEKLRQVPRSGFHPGVHLSILSRDHIESSLKGY